MKPNFVIIDCFSANTQITQFETDNINMDERYTKSAKILKEKLFNEVLKDDVNLLDQDIDIIEERRQVSINMYHKGLL